MSASVTSQVGHRGSLVWLHTKAHCECLTTALSEALSLISVCRVDNYFHNVSCRTSSHMTGRLQCVGTPVGCQSTQRGWLEQKLLSLGLRRDTAFQSNCQRMKKKKADRGAPLRENQSLIIIIMMLKLNCGVVKLQCLTLTTLMCEIVTTTSDIRYNTVR